MAHKFTFTEFFNNPEINVNVIAVHWQPLATWDNYFRAAANAVKVGQHAGEVIGVNLLLNGLGQKPSQIHAIGHSLGNFLIYGLYLFFFVLVDLFALFIISSQVR